MALQGFHRCTLADRRLLAHQIYQFLVVVPPEFTYTAGQFIDFYVSPCPEMGGLTITSTPAETKKTECITLVARKPLSSSTPIGILTHPPFDVIGAEILARPRGRLIFQPDILTQPTLFIAGGMGITPLYAIYKQAREVNPNFKAPFFYSARQGCHLFATEMKAWGAHLIETGGGNVKQRMTGRDIQPCLDGNTIVYLCGPPSFIQAMKKVLQGVQLRIEDWS